MKAEKLNKWAELLLDTGKRNNLIHFKDTKMGSVEILSPDFVTLLIARNILLYLRFTTPN